MSESQIERFRMQRVLVYVIELSVQSKAYLGSDTIIPSHEKKQKKVELL